MPAKKILHYINSLPFPLTIRHYSVFGAATAFLKDGELYSAESWDALRMNHPHFSIAESREEWLKAAESKIKKDGQDGAMPLRAEEISRILNECGISSLFSVGVGGAGLEYQIKKANPDLQMTCSDFSPNSVDTLKKVFTECDSIRLFDMKNKDWSPALQGVSADKQLVLMNHVDIEFTNNELREMFQNMHDSGIRNILIVCNRLTARGLLSRFVDRLIRRLKGEHFVFAGYLRTKKTFPPLWGSLYQTTEVETPLISGFLLKSKN
ncbi:hypothetical protein A2851_02475 [Candidatus Kaiserbacteria bacterium RIFCSPHIGHO2_01_FULL_53_29]|uniref:Methyltransferase domain-containing protein n=1 Tax=Candidatus Kaiserbacteria bacterium RIFCSPHIGHO2_01_FULL_53_29 TaxID=1798480 RepID=A0A1F6CX27_9BACT|nr:MAG: hypothetical protein A2851_02475 [Candidatus Kaiserbacteria bacterium RIFCSPHIGHO2_01_FULL_53_29]